MKAYELNMYSEIPVLIGSYVGMSFFLTSLLLADLKLILISGFFSIFIISKVLISLIKKSKKYLLVSIGGVVLNNVLFYLFLDGFVFLMIFIIIISMYWGLLTFRLMK